MPGRRPPDRGLIATSTHLSSFLRLPVMSDELLNEFIFDSREHLSVAGGQLLELEKKRDSLPVINALMGTIHTIKGTSGFFDLKNLYQLLNNAESLLQTLREKEGRCCPKIIDLLLQALDTVEAILDRLENGDDDKVEWIEALTRALSEAEAALEKSPFRETAAAAPEAPKTDGRRADLNGRVSLLPLKDGQLAEESENFPGRVAAMFEAGLKGLVVDLRPLSSVNNTELKALMAAGRKCPDKTVFLLDAERQQALERVFKVLNLDAFMHFFSQESQAVDFINGGLEG